MKFKNIPTANTKEDIKAREKIISDFYQEWKRNNPTQRLYNIDLKDYINILTYLLLRLLNMLLGTIFPRWRYYNWILF